MTEKSIFAFLDLLAFKSFLKEDFKAATTIINNYQMIISQMQENKQIDSFDNFIPFSDSIFISSKEKPSFLIELSRFIKYSFQYVANSFIIKKNIENPFDVPVSTGKIIDGKPTFVTEIEKWYPPLFRGGVAYGEITEVPALMIDNNEKKVFKNLFGNAVVSAYLLEQTVKGPRIIIDDNLMSNPNIDKSLVFKSFDSDRHELYWPLWNCNEDVDFSFNNEIWQLLEISILLWKAFNHFEVSMQYYNFIKLITKGFTRFYENDPVKHKTAKENVLSTLELNNLLDKKDDLI